MSLVFIGIGSNLNQPKNQVNTAFSQLHNLTKTQLLQQSKLYKTAPIGAINQPDFINAVALIDTELSPIELLNKLQAIEKSQKRERKIHWGARTLDLDILLFDEQIINTKRLKIPHPLMFERGFVLKPMAEIAPDLQLPTMDKSLAELAALNHDEVLRLDF